MTIGISSVLCSELLATVFGALSGDKVVAAKRLPDVQMSCTHKRSQLIPIAVLHRRPDSSSLLDARIVGQTA
jgi:hypothetical protein